MNRIRLALGVVLAIASITAAAQSWPAKPIRWIVPTVGGSAVDVNARRVAPKLGEYLGQPIIVENRAGGNSAIGAREVARAPADGYTVFQAVINNALNDLLAPDNARLNRELMPVTSLFSSPLVMVAHPSMPGSLGEFLAAAKVKPPSPARHGKSIVRAAPPGLNVNRGICVIARPRMIDRRTDR